MIPEHIYAGALRGFLGPIVPFLDDDRVTEILVNGPHEIFIERGGQLSKTEAAFSSAEHLHSALRVIAQYAGRSFDERHPILEAWFPDGSRVEALLPSISPGGPSVAIRRFSKSTLTIDKLLELGALTKDAAAALRVFVECKLNIVVAGGTGSGKTSLLNALSAFIPEEERTIVIEDARELSLQREHVVRLEARPPDERGRDAVGIRELFKASLRLRPDRIVLGEIRGGEALELIQAMTSGHGGCLTTVHATYPTDALDRLTTMALMGGLELPLPVLRVQLAGAVDMIVQTARFRDGKRRVTHITEVGRVDRTGAFQTKDLFLHAPPAGDASQAGFALRPTGALPKCIRMLQDHGFDLPESVHAAARGRTRGAPT